MHILVNDQAFYDEIICITQDLTKLSKCASLQSLFRTHLIARIFSSFKKLQKFIVQGGDSDLEYISPFQRNTNIWKHAAFGAKQECLESRLKVSIEHHKINICQSDDPTSMPTFIDLRDWSTAAQKSIVDFQTSVNGLLPDSCSAAEFPAEKLSDDLSSPDSPHLQASNKGWLTSWTASVQKALFQPEEARHGLFFSFGISSKAVYEWIKIEQDRVLPSLANILSLTCGIGLEDHKYGHLRFHSSGGACRNVWILQNGLIVFNDPKKQLGRHDSGPQLFAFPIDLTKYLALYLYVIRPIGMELLRRTGQQLPQYASHIWAHVTNNSKSALWSGAQVAKHIKIATNDNFGVVLSPTLIRRILNKLFQRHIPTLFAINKQSIVDQQAQHQTLTSLRHYGWVSHFPPIKNLRLHQPIRHLAICEIWHALLHLGPINEGWWVSLRGCPLMRHRKCYDEAVNCARSLITDVDASALLDVLPFKDVSQVG